MDEVYMLLVNAEYGYGHIWADCSSYFVNQLKTTHSKTLNIPPGRDFNSILGVGDPYFGVIKNLQIIIELVTHSGSSIGVIEKTFCESDQASHQLNADVLVKNQFPNAVQQTYTISNKQTLVETSMSIALVFKQMFESCISITSPHYCICVIDYHQIFDNNEHEHAMTLLDRIRQKECKEEKDLLVCIPVVATGSNTTIQKIHGIPVYDICNTNKQISNITQLDLEHYLCTQTQHTQQIDANLKKQLAILIAIQLATCFVSTITPAKTSNNDDEKTFWSAIERIRKKHSCYLYRWDKQSKTLSTQQYNWDKL